MVTWNVTPCSLVGNYRYSRAGGACNVRNSTSSLVAGTKKSGSTLTPPHS
jgi:hypothetical protein